MHGHCDCTILCDTFLMLSHHTMKTNLWCPPAAVMSHMMVPSQNKIKFVKWHWHCLCCFTVFFLQLNMKIPSKLPNFLYWNTFSKMLKVFIVVHPMWHDTFIVPSPKYYCASCGCHYRVITNQLIQNEVGIKSSS